MTEIRYCMIYGKRLKPFIETYWFQQDNDRSKYTKDYFIVSNINWWRSRRTPPESPDLNRWAAVFNGKINWHNRRKMNANNNTTTSNSAPCLIYHGLFYFGAFWLPYFFLWKIPLTILRMISLVWKEDTPKHIQSQQLCLWYDSYTHLFSFTEMRVTLPNHVSKWLSVTKEKRRTKHQLYQFSQSYQILVHTCMPTCIMIPKFCWSWLSSDNNFTNTCF